MEKAVVLLSGGLDSATTLYFAKKNGFACFPLIFDYGQRHRRELSSARAIAKKAGVKAEVLKIRLPWKGSSLLDNKKRLPRCGNAGKGQIPSTYVPARNIIFLSYAVSYAEAIGAGTVFIGAHIQDYSGYPDCRPEFIRAFSSAITKGTRSGVEHKPVRIDTPLINKGKADIVRLAKRLGVPLELTWSCYGGGKFPCGKCDSCYYRIAGFAEAGIVDPAYKRE